MTTTATPTVDEMLGRYYAAYNMNKGVVVSVIADMKHHATHDGEFSAAAKARYLELKNLEDALGGQLEMRCTISATHLKALRELFN